jgi:hypothetical protein
MSVEFNEGTLEKVVLNSGTVALPFMPKSVAQEELDCKRYYEKSYNYSVVPGTSTYDGAVIFNGSDNNTTKLIYAPFSFAVSKRIAVTPVIYDGVGNINKLTYIAANNSKTDNQGVTAVSSSDRNCFVLFNGAVAGLLCQWTASAEL